MQQHQGKQRAALREGLGEADQAPGMFSHGMLPQGGLLRKQGTVVEHGGGSAMFLFPGHQDQSRHWLCGLLSPISWIYPLSII